LVSEPSAFSGNAVSAVAHRIPTELRHLADHLP
jgi:hypothetical protein